MKSSIQSTWKKRLLPVCAICVLLVAAVLLFTSRKPDDSLELADNATMGILPGVDLEQRQAELQQLLDESMISFSINTSPVFETQPTTRNFWW